VERRLGISVSVGLSYNKFLAKVASDLDKPRGFTAIGRKEARSFLAEQPVSLIWGVGHAMQARLAKDGFSTIGALQEADPRELARRYGAIGVRLAELSGGHDAREVKPERAAKSVSAETTLDHDAATAEELLPILRSLSEKVSRRLKASGLAGAVVVLKLKSSDFKLRTRNTRLESRTNLADRIFEAGRMLLKGEIDGTRFRLIGIGVAALGESEPADPARFLDPAAEKRARAEGAMDQIRARFGQDGLALGLTFVPKRTGGGRRS
jgi:DNA polymerase-4